MSLYRSMSSFVLIIALWRNKYRGHHCKRTKRGRNHITHNISVIVLACPDKPAFCFHNTRYNIIDQAIEISKSCFFELILKFCIKYSLEYFFEFRIVCLGDCIFRAKPYILFCIQCIVETASRKAFNGCSHVVHAHRNSRCFELLYKGAFLFTVF